MLSDPCNGFDDNLAIYRAAKALNIPVIINTPPRLNSRRFKLKSSPYEGKSFQEKAVLYIKKVISKAKLVGLHE